MPIKFKSKAGYSEFFHGQVACELPVDQLSRISEFSLKVLGIPTVMFANSQLDTIESLYLCQHLDKPKEVFLGIVTHNNHWEKTVELDSKVDVLTLAKKQVKGYIRHQLYCTKNLFRLLTFNADIDSSKKRNWISGVEWRQFSYQQETVESGVKFWYERTPLIAKTEVKEQTKATAIPPHINIVDMGGRRTNPWRVQPDMEDLVLPSGKHIRERVNDIVNLYWDEYHTLFCLLCLGGSSLPNLIPETEIFTKPSLFVNSNELIDDILSYVILNE